MNFGSSLKPMLIAIPAAGLVLGFVLDAIGRGAWSASIWAAFTIPVLLALLAEIVASLRRGNVGLDIVAALSMTAALIFGEELAAVVVALMYSGGQYLEEFRRASRTARNDSPPRPRSAYCNQAPRRAARKYRD